MSSQKRLFLLDAYALIFRGYYALIKNPRINSKGMDTSAILGFTNSLLDVIKREKPDHLAVAFDKGGSEVRSEAFPEYKANRQETLEAIQIAIPYIKQILKAMHIPIIEKKGFEADDLIGTLAKQAEKEGYKTYMVTPDKDFAQLVSENIFMYKPSRMGNGIEIWGIPEVQKKFEVENPEQVIDYLGMMGDAIDNIPGLPGVGDKTAKKFIKQYGSMENLFKNTHELKGKMKEKVEANKDLGLLSKELATIMLDCPVTFNENDYELSTPNFEAVAEVFKELEFRRTANTFSQIFQSSLKEKAEENKSEETTQNNTTAGEQFDLFSTVNVKNSESETAKNAEKKVYQHITTPFALKLLTKKLLQQKAIGFHIETENNNVFNPLIIGISFSYQKNTSYYIKIDENTNNVLNTLKDVFENSNIEKIGHNIKHCIKLLHQFNIQLKGNLFDVTLAHYLLQPDTRHDLNFLAETFLNQKPQNLTDIIGKKGKNQLALRNVEISKQTNYVAEQADLVFQLKQIFENNLNEVNLKSLYNNIEIPLLKVLAAMELEGIKLDTEFLNSLASKLENDIQHLETSIFKEAGEEFNLASPRQLGIVLFENLKLVDKPKKTKTGQYATGEEILSKLAPDFEVVKHILEWRGLVKLKNTYIDALPNEVNEITNRIHTTYSQSVAATGRLSSNNPNLQNIPIRTKRGREVRKAFVPRSKDYTLLAADYSQIELRIIAALSNDESMIESFKKGDDIHAATAAKIFNIPLSEVTRSQRGDAKAVNFGIIYGQGAFTLSQQLNKSRSEAKELIDNYYKTFPKLKNYISNQVENARENGYVETVLGRRRYLKNINSRNAMVRAADERNAVNAPIQGSAADIIKLAMINIYKIFEEKQYKSKMLLQVHEELVFDLHNSEKDEVKKLIKQQMESAYKLKVPLTVDLGEGSNWLEAH
ncbi:MAG TPA: DNA polymerase I [Flavobacteriaceae bacterium]|nr:DNA polymerase I [Flavobacteriaceae bacterium]